MMAPQLPWTEPMVCLLLELVLEKGANSCDRHTSKQTWNNVNEAFFSSEIMEPFRSLHYKEGRSRRLRDKYKQITELVMSEPGWNDFYSGLRNEFVGKTGGLKRISKLIRQCQYSIQKSQGDEQISSQNMVNKEADLSGNKRSLMLLKGKSSRNKNKKQLRDESYLITNLYLDEEELIETKLITEVENHRLSLDIIIKESQIPSTDQLILHSLGMETILNIFCTCGKNFSADHFKDNMKEMGLQPITYHKLYTELQKWKRKVFFDVEQHMNDDHVDMNEYSDDQRHHHHNVIEKKSKTNQIS